MICDWCGKKYPETVQNKKNFHVLKKYVHAPMVCKHCYDQFRKQKNKS